MGTGSGDECKEEVQQMLTPLKQGARKNGGVANLTATSTALLMAAGNFGVHIPTPIRNNVAQLRDRNEDLNFDHEETIDGSPRLVYKPMGPFMTDVCVEEVMKLINVTIDGPQWKEKGDDPHLRSRLFRQWVVPIIPPHLALAFDQPILFPFAKEIDDSGEPRKMSRGRKRSHPLIVGLKGTCAAKAYGCPTGAFVGCLLCATTFIHSFDSIRLTFLLSICIVC
jgi:hypothetical protein